MTVEDYLSKSASLSLFKELADGSGYWVAAYEFFLENQLEQYEDLSFKQKNWLIRIKGDLIEEAKR